MDKRIIEISQRLNLKAEVIEYGLKSYMEKNKVDLDTAIRDLDGKQIQIIPLSEAKDHEDQSPKTPCGMKDLDEAMKGGISAGSTMIIAAPSGEGKTQFMVSLSYHFLKQSIDCLWISYEESHADIWNRFKETGIEEKTPAWCPLDLENNRLNFVEEVIKKFKRDHPFFVVFIDQLSFLAPKLQDKTEVDKIQGNYAMYLGLISQQIKNIAMEQKIIIVFAHQLGRTGDTAYSDMVKHSADKIIYLKREQDTQANANEEFTKNTLVVFKKNRPYGNRPKFLMTVKDGLFVPVKSDVVEYMEKKLGFKRVDNLFN